MNMTYAMAISRVKHLEAEREEFLKFVRPLAFDKAGELKWRPGWFELRAAAQVLLTKVGEYQPNRVMK